MNFIKVLLLFNFVNFARFLTVDETKLMHVQVVRLIFFFLIGLLSFKCINLQKTARFIFTF